VVDTLSLDIGTVRLKELFFDTKKGFKVASNYVEEIIEAVPIVFHSELIIGIGGTIHALSKAIMRTQNYPIDTLHAFEYDYTAYEKFIRKVAKASVLDLKDFPISSSRYDTIREGSTIFYQLNKKLGTERVLTSKAGVREGVYLSDILRNSNYQFPHNFNVSMRSLIDRFALLPRHCSHAAHICKTLYDVTYDRFDAKRVYEKELLTAAKLVLIFNRLNIYSNSDYSFFFLLENLNFSLSHQEKLLIATLLRYSQKGKVGNSVFKSYDLLLPDLDRLRWLTFLLSTTEALIRNKAIVPIEASFDGKVLKIVSERELFLAKEAIKKVKKPKPFAVILEKRSRIGESDG